MTNANNDSTTSPSSELKRIWIFALGSRGDIQPYVAIAHGLVKQGYDVSFFCTGVKFVAFAESFGCKGVSLSDRDVETMVRSNPLIKKGMMNGDVMTLMKGVQEETAVDAPAYRASLLRQIETEGPPDLCITMALSTYFGWYLSIHYRVPFMSMATVAAVYNQEHPPFGLPKIPFVGSFVYHNVFLKGFYKGSLVYDKFFESNVLKTVTFSVFKAGEKDRSLPLFVLSSPEIASVLAGGSDMLPSNKYRVVGTTVINKHLQLERIDNFGGQEVFDSVQKFLGAGKKPAYLGWGSMICKSPEFMVTFCARAVHRSGQRAVILGGFAGLSMELLKSTDIESDILQYAKTNILFVQQAPHEWLFPRVSVIVHHGGAGTTTAALRAGIPSIITPVFADQWDFSFFLRKTGVGVGFAKQFHKVGSDELGDAIRKAVSDAAMTKRAHDLGETLRSEDGVARAVEGVKQYWNEYCVTGRFHKLFPRPLPS